MCDKNKSYRCLLTLMAAVFFIPSTALPSCLPEAGDPSMDLIAPPPDINKPQVKIEARFFLLEPNGPPITDFLKDTLRAKKMTDVNVVHVPAGEKTHLYVLNDEQLQKLTRWVQNQKTARYLQSPRVLVLDREQATISVTTDVRYIKEYKEPNEAGGKLEPIMDTITTGVIFDVTPELQSDKQAILLNMKCQLTHLLKMTKTSYKPGYEIELPEVEQTKLQTRILEPEGQTLLFPMGIVHEEVETKAKPITKTMHLYLLVMATSMPPDPNLVKWMEGKAVMTSIATAIRSYAAEKGPKGALPTNIVGTGKTALGFTAADLQGVYFQSSDFSMTVTSLYPLVFTITCTPTGASAPMNHARSGRALDAII